MMNRRLSYIVSMILSFLIMVCLTILIFFSCLAVTVFRADFLARLMNDRYYQSVMDTLTETLKQKLASPSNLPKEAFDGLFSRGQMKEDVKSNLNAKLAGINSGYDRERVRQKVIERLKSYADGRGADISGTNLESLADYCMEEYDRHIGLFFLDDFAALRNRFDELFAYILPGFSMLLILLNLFLFKLHRFKHRAVRFCACSMFSTALMLIPFPLFLLLCGAYRRINITPEYVKYLLVETVNKGLTGLVLSGIAAAAAGAVLAVACFRMRKNGIIPYNKYERTG